MYSLDNYIVGMNVSMDGGFVDGGFGGEFGGDMGMGMETTVKDPIMSNPIFVGGICTLTLAISVVLGILWAKRKIKKGFGLYED